MNINYTKLTEVGSGLTPVSHLQGMSILENQNTVYIQAPFVPANK